VAAAVTFGIVFAATRPTDPIAGKDRSIYMVGDSLLAGASWGNDSFDDPAPDGYGVKVDAFMGQTAADHLAGVTHYAGGDAPERLVIALGTNDARDGGWGPDDEAAFDELVGAAPARTCIVFVLPAAGPQAAEPGRTQIATAASAIRTIAEAEPRHQVADFAEFITAHPGLIAADGIHLRGHEDGNENGVDHGAQAAYRDWLWTYIDRCQGAPQAE
jgi:hypothetical protein